MKSNELIRRFVDGATSGVASSCHAGVPSLSINGDELLSYATRVAVRDGDLIRVSPHKYTVTTAKQLSCLRRMVPANLLAVLDCPASFKKLEGAR